MSNFNSSAIAWVVLVYLRATRSQDQIQLSAFNLWDWSDFSNASCFVWRQPLGIILYRDVFYAPWIWLPPLKCQWDGSGHVSHKRGEHGWRDVGCFKMANPMVSYFQVEIKWKSECSGSNIVLNFTIIWRRRSPWSWCDMTHCLRTHFLRSFI